MNHNLHKLKCSLGNGIHRNITLIFFNWTKDEDEHGKREEILRKYLIDFNRFNTEEFDDFWLSLILVEILFFIF